MALVKSNSSLTEAPNSVPNTLLVVQGIWCPLLAFVGTRHTYRTHTYMQANIHAHKIF